MKKKNDLKNEFPIWPNHCACKLRWSSEPRNVKILAMMLNQQKNR